MSRLPHVGAVTVKQKSEYSELSSPLGTRYHVFPTTRSTQYMGIDSRNGNIAFAEMIYGRREDDPDDPGGWLPVECLQIEED